MTQTDKNSLEWFRSPRIWRNIALLLPFSCFLSFLLVEFFMMNPIATEEQKNLEAELRLLTPPDEAMLIESDASHKTSQADAHESYFLDWTADQIFKYYEAPLEENGWRFSEQYDITYQAVGRRYCKGDYTASLDYYKSGYIWKYSIWVTWGLTSECHIERGRLSTDYWFCIGFPLSLIISLVTALIFRRISHRTDA